VSAAARTYERARHELNLGHLADARALLEQAEHEVGEAEQDLRGRILISRAYLAAESGKVVRGRAWCRDALDLPVSEFVKGLAYAQLAGLSTRVGEVSRALAEFEQAIPLLVTDSQQHGWALINRGNVHLQVGNSQAAARDFAAASELLVRSGDHLSAAQAAYNLGYAKLISGDLVTALHEMERAALVLAPESPVYAAICAQDQAEALISAGLVERGQASLAYAAKVYGRARMAQSQAECELVYARSLRPINPKLSAQVARRALKRLKAHGSAGWVSRAEAAVLAADVAAGKKGPQLIERLLATQGGLKQGGFGYEAKHVQLLATRVQVRRGLLDQAAETLALDTVRAGDPIYLRLLECEVRAEHAIARARPRQAFNNLRRGLGQLHSWQGSFGSLDLQSGVVGHGRSLATLGLRLAAQDGRPEVLFEWSERARTLVSRVTPIRPPENPEVAEGLAEVRWLQSLSPAPRSTEAKRLREVQLRLRHKAWFATGEIGAQITEPITLAALVGELESDQALVAYVRADDLLLALVATDAGGTVVQLGSVAAVAAELAGLMPALETAASDLPDTFAESVRADVVARLRRLDQLLVQPILALVGGRRLALTPSTVLAGVPWLLLEGFWGRPVTVAQSATSLVARRQDDLRVALAGFVAGPRVPRAEQEVTASAAAWGQAQVVKAEQATVSAVTELAARVDVLHVAAHGRHALENPLFSGIDLVDGPWFGYDIDQLKQVPDVVLLSACELGRSTVRSGEELLGMTAAWLHAGTRCVIASPTAVNDQVAHDVLVGVHKRMAGGLDPASALATAIPKPSLDRPPAPFVCFG
jgi:tetratricopeptide (TPR) repeat protein